MAKGTDSSVETALHPVVAQLAASAQLTSRGDEVVFPPAALAAVAASLASADTDADVVTQHLCALAAKLWRVSGQKAQPALVGITLLLLTRLGSAAAVTDELMARGMDSKTASVLGKDAELRAPAMKKEPAGPAVKARRGLSGDR